MQSDALDYNDPVLIENIKSYEAQYIEMQQSRMEESNYLAKFSDYTNPHMPSKAFKPPPPPLQKNFSEIFSINDPDLLLKNQEQVQNEIHNFYQQLYTRVPSTKNLTQFVNFPMKSVTPEENIKLKEPIKMQEIAEFIKTLSPHKAPGITGLTSAFLHYLLD